MKTSRRHVLQRTRRFPSWQEGVNLKVGDMAETDRNGAIAKVKIVAIKKARCESGICFQVDPPPVGNSSTWFDAHWFRPIKK